MNNLPITILAFAFMILMLAFGLQTYKVTTINTKIQAWESADACLAQADANIKTNHMRKAKSEVEATHSLYCIQRARSIVK